MQKFRLENGVELVGHSALRDTMKDLILDLPGAAVTAGAGYIGARRKDRAEHTANRCV